jgi:hypothetical protein
MQPVLTIERTGTNEARVSVTNAAAEATYELWWVPALNDPMIGWEVLGIGDPGQTNLDVSLGLTPAAFFRVSVGTNYNGVWDYQWANPNDPTLGALTIVVDAPTNTMVLQ